MDNNCGGQNTWMIMWNGHTKIVDKHYWEPKDDQVKFLFGKYAVDHIVDKISMNLVWCHCYLIY